MRYIRQCSTVIMSFRTSLHKLWWHRMSAVYAYISVKLYSLACLTGRDRLQQRILTNSFQDTSWEISNNAIYHLIGKFFLRLRKGKVLSYWLPATKKGPCTRFLALSVTTDLLTSAPFLTAHFLTDWLITWILAAVPPPLFLHLCLGKGDHPFSIRLSD